MTGPPSAGAFLRRAFELMRADAPRAVIIIALLVGCGAALDAGYAVANDADPSNEGMSVLGATVVVHPAALANVGLSVLGVALQYWVMRGVLRDWGLGPLTFRLPGFFALVLVESVGIVLGLVFLVIPGLILLVRWSLAGPVLVGSDKGVFESLRISWLETDGYFWPIFAALLAVNAPSLLLGLAEATIGIEVAGPLADTILINLVAYAALITSWYLTLAMFTVILEPDPLTEVFE